MLGITQVDGLAMTMCARRVAVKAATLLRNCAPAEWPMQDVGQGGLAGGASVPS